ncbi:hypothetical protein DFS34DRAFT_645711 [Phlyctochytrium arcticum]|nr:hypothetical protein DFS34DRAFT_645711 [Phlyctochytrium arcticum]
MCPLFPPPQFPGKIAHFARITNQPFSTSIMSPSRADAEFAAAVIAKLAAERRQRKEKTRAKWRARLAAVFFICRGEEEYQEYDFTQSQWGTKAQPHLEMMPLLLPPRRSRPRAENILGDADRQMIPCAVHPPRGCDKGKSPKLLRGSDATSPPAEAEQATCRKHPGGLRSTIIAFAHFIVILHHPPLLLAPNTVHFDILIHLDAVHSSDVLELGISTIVAFAHTSSPSSSPATFVGPSLARVSSACSATTSSFPSDVFEIVLSTIVAFAFPLMCLKLCSPPSLRSHTLHRHRYIRRRTNSAHLDNMFRHHIVISSDVLEAMSPFRADEDFVAAVLAEHAAERQRRKTSPVQNGGQG